MEFQLIFYPKNLLMVHKSRTYSGFKPLINEIETIKVKDQSSREVHIKKTDHGVLLEPFLEEIGMSKVVESKYQTSLYWSLMDKPTSAGALALLPTARSAHEFGELLFENEICPLVNNIICVDKEDRLERYIATTTPNRKGVTGSVPLSGWVEKYKFPLAKPEQLKVEKKTQLLVLLLLPITTLWKKMVNFTYTIFLPIVLGQIE